MQDFKIDKQCIPYIIEWIEEQINTWNTTKEKKDYDSNENWDANDIVIFQSCMLPVLKNSIDKDLNSSELLDKGLMFVFSKINSLIALIPVHEKEKIGKMLLIGYRFQAERIIELTELLSPEYVLENQNLFGHEIDVLENLRKIHIAKKF